MGAAVSMADLFVASLLGPESAGEGAAEAEKPSTLSRRELEEWAEIFRTRPTGPPGDEEG
jgi:hypothetical protein